ncbi:MAG: phosphotransferase [Desulfobacterales bacterium]|nr:phosphotransferase [Desulfobacterales bacterium]
MHLEQLEPPDLPEAVITCLLQMDRTTDDCCAVQPMAGDGSDRHFFRLTFRDGATLVAILPGPDEKSMAEARAAHRIGIHLFQRGVPVPEILAFDPGSGALLCEDLGTVLLQDAAALASPEERLALYRQAIEVLVHMQLSGCQGFDPGWCWDTVRYDKELMLTRESGYFLEAFCKNDLGLKKLPKGLDREFQRLAARGAGSPAGFFLHRDFQSRNLMVLDNRIRVIDFQGGRLGPLPYDLASLLLDPYVALDGFLQKRLREYYLDLLEERLDIDRQRFRRDYAQLALQRNLQIIGAFAFLCREKHKKFFRPYLKPAVKSLYEQLAMTTGADYPCLRQLSAFCLTQLGRPAG